MRVSRKNKNEYATFWGMGETEVWTKSHLYLIFCESQKLTSSPVAEEA